MDKSGRNFRCPDYDKCLNRAAKIDAIIMCRMCSKAETEEDIKFSEGDIIGSLMLIEAIFNKRPVLAEEYGWLYELHMP